MESHTLSRVRSVTHETQNTFQLRSKTILPFLSSQLSRRQLVSKYHTERQRSWTDSRDARKETKKQKKTCYSMGRQISQEYYTKPPIQPDLSLIVQVLNFWTLDPKNHEALPHVSSSHKASTNITGSCLHSLQTQSTQLTSIIIPDHRRWCVRA